MAINIGKPKRYEKEEDYILKWCNTATVIKAIPDKQQRIKIVRQVFKDNFDPKKN